MSNFLNVFFCFLFYFFLCTFVFSVLKCANYEYFVLCINLVIISSSFLFVMICLAICVVNCILVVVLTHISSFFLLFAIY